LDPYENLTVTITTENNEQQIRRSDERFLCNLRYVHRVPIRVIVLSLWSRATSGNPSITVNREEAAACSISLHRFPGLPRTRIKISLDTTWEAVLWVSQW